MATPNYKYFYIAYSPAKGDYEHVSTCTLEASSAADACKKFRKNNPTKHLIGCIPTNIKPTKEKAK